MANELAASSPPTGEVEALRPIFEKYIGAVEKRHGADKVPCYVIAGHLREMRDEIIAALSIAPATADGWLLDLRAKWPIGAQFRIEHDGFAGTVRGYYEREDGYRGIVGQITSDTGAKIVHVYGEKWLVGGDD